MTRAIYLCVVRSAAGVLTAAGSVQAQVVVYHSFGGGTADGANPQGSLLQFGPSLYGLASAGGSVADAGVIFEIGLDGSGYGVTHAFAKGSDGGNPFGSLTESTSTFFGLTVNAGSGGRGTLFRIGANGDGFAVVHAFLGSPSDGDGPNGSLALSGSTFFGTTIGGGSAGGGGTIFKVNADGTGYAISHSFAGGAGDGKNPVGGAPAISGTTLYGTTSLGGLGGGGVVYKINTDGSGFTVVHSFIISASDGFDPFGSVILSGNSIYGMTQGGGATNHGAIYKMNTDGSGYTILHSFGGGTTDGRRPLGELLISGDTLYGMTYQGGSADLGTIFSIGIDGSNYDLLHSFLGGPNDGAQPASDLIQIGSSFYGTTTIGGVSNEGTIFSFTPVPEPSSLVLAAGGALAALRLRRRGA